MDAIWYLGNTGSMGWFACVFHAIVLLVFCYLGKIQSTIAFKCWH